MMIELIRVGGKNVEVHLKKRKQEVLAIMRMIAEAQKAMTRNQEGMNLTGAQEGQIMDPTQAGAPDNQNNEASNKKPDQQIQIQDEVRDEIHQMMIQVP